jgi:hypothetical protein
MRAYEGRDRAANIPSGAKQAAGKVRLQGRTVPQRLKPRCKQETYGTAEAVPLTKRDFFRSL